MEDKYAVTSKDVTFSVLHSLVCVVALTWTALHCIALSRLFFIYKVVKKLCFPTVPPASYYRVRNCTLNMVEPVTPLLKIVLFIP